MMAKLETLAMRISEGFQTDSDEISAQRNNLFHRPVNIFRSRDLSYSLGYLRNGLRSIAFLQTSTIQVNYGQIVLALKNHLPLVINVYRDKKEPTSPDFYRAIYKLSNIRCFQFKVSSAAEHLALILVGQRIAEFSLMPVIIYADYIPDTNIDIQVPDDEFIATFLGSPDDQIKSPTPAQEIIFGPTRRRLPNWFSFDNPVTSGLLTDSEAQVFQSASHSRFFGYHLPALIEQSFLEYESLTGIKIRKISESNSSANYLFYSYHTEAANLYAKTPSLMKTVEWLELKQLFPFPDVELKSRLKYKRAVTLLDFSGSNDFSPLHATISTILKDLHIPFYRAQCTPEINIDLLEVAVENMASKAPKQNYYLGIPFSRQHSNFPKHQVLMQQIENKYPAINEEVFVTEEPLENLPPITHDVPLLMRRYQNHGPNFTRQNRFFDDTAIFYKLKQKSELVADPFAALDVVPAATAGFDDQSEVREAMPVFLPEKCTGCGDCFVTCPHAALPPLALGIEKLLRTGSEIVTAKQMTVTRITPMIKNIARTCARVADEEPVNNVSDLLPRAFEKVAGQMQMEGDKLEVAYSEFSAILHELGDFPVAITDLFYRRPEAQVAGSGELFSVVVNPVSCTGCGLCAESCAESAIEMRYLDPDLEDRARDNFHLWEKLPDTSGDTIRRLQHEDEFTSLAAVLLSRNYYMTGIGGTEKIKSGSKKLLHFITALTEAVVQPSHVKQVQEIEQQIESLSDKVHLRLSDALPREDLENLSRLLINAPRKKVHLTDLLNGDFKDFEGSFIDTEELRRKTDLIGDLKAMKWILEEGPGGTGRSRFGLVLAGRSLEWAQEYPFSHFSQPAVFHQTGSVSNQCLGLFKGLLRFHLDHLKILRRAALEAADKYDAS
ncbi:MAG: 4Fe-4S binding protein, partial [Saprospiraceae bacterium]|nr:4Fe-4S binding protein [Saprospiraceae bacterium]